MRLVNSDDGTRLMCHIRARFVGTTRSLVNLCRLRASFVSGTTLVPTTRGVRICRDREVRASARSSIHAQPPPDSATLPTLALSEPPGRRASFVIVTDLGEGKPEPLGARWTEWRGGRRSTCRLGGGARTRPAWPAKLSCAQLA